MMRCRYCLGCVYSPAESPDRWYHREFIVMDKHYRVSEYNIGTTLAPEPCGETCAGPLEALVGRDLYSSED